MKLSIIVPAYNVEAYLRTCLDSLVGQTIDDYEIILVNDGSTDGTQTIIDEYREKHPGLIRCLIVENGGQGRARNIAIRQARGDYLGFVDSDDWVDPRMFEKLYTAAEAAGADMAQCDCYECWENGRKDHLSMTGRRKEDVNTAVWNKLVRRSVAEGVEFAEHLWYEDIAYVVRLMLRVETMTDVCEPLYYYRRGQTSTMNNGNTQRNLEMITILEMLKGPLLEAGRRDWFETLVVRHLLHYSINRVNIQDSPERMEVLEKFRAYSRENLPQLLKTDAFRRESTKAKVIEFANYWGIYTPVRLLLRYKEDKRNA